MSRADVVGREVGTAWVADQYGRAVAGGPAHEGEHAPRYFLAVEDVASDHHGAGSFEFVESLVEDVVEADLHLDAVLSGVERDRRGGEGVDLGGGGGGRGGGGGGAP
jgi:hypothetical protein